MKEVVITRPREEFLRLRCESMKSQNELCRKAGGTLFGRKIKDVYPHPERHTYLVCDTCGEDITGPTVTSVGVQGDDILNGYALCDKCKPKGGQA